MKPLTLNYIRAQNIYGNKRAPSLDIASHFAVNEQLWHICEGGHLSSGERYVLIVWLVM